MGLFSCDYLDDRGSIFGTDYVCNLTMQSVDRYTANSLCLCSKYVDCIHYKRKYSWFFIVNATYKALGKGDSKEIKQFGEWKCDFIVLNHPEFLKEYYNFGPQIVEAIDESDNPQEVYKAIEEKYLSKCLDLIKEGSDEKAFAIYLAMYSELKKKWLLEC